MWDKDFREEALTRSDIDSFSVALCAREELSVLRVFVEHYQRVGAEQIFLFVDDEREASEAVTAAMQAYGNVAVRGCDAGFWKQRFPSEDLPTITEKQCETYKFAIAQNQSDWLFFCDADEFIVGNQHIGEALAQLPENVSGVRLKNSEAVWGPSDDIAQPFGCSYERFSFKAKGRFMSAKKKPIRKLISLLVYGRDWREMAKGAAGHSKGKHFLRRGVCPDEMDVHFSKIDGKNIPWMPRAICAQHNWHVVHFDAISLHRWQEKWRRRVAGQTKMNNSNPTRLGQRDKVDRAIKRGNAHRLFRRYYGINRWQQFVLMRLGLLKKISD